MAGPLDKHTWLLAATLLLKLIVPSWGGQTFGHLITDGAKVCCCVLVILWLAAACWSKPNLAQGS